MCALGYLYAVVSTRLLNANANVNVPIRPTNIETIINILPEKLNCAVIPALNPTVAKADICSKTTFKMSKCGSVIHNKNIIIRLKVAAKTKIENALNSKSFEIDRFPNSTFFFPRIVAIDEIEINKNVDVFNPPPVEPEDAPMNIKNIINTNVGLANCVKSTELKPAVRVVTD